MEPSQNQSFQLGKESLMPQEEKLEITNRKKHLKIGVAKELATDENRVALAPHAVEMLVNSGHQVFVEKGAGDNARFTDLMYTSLGGILTPNRPDIFNCDVILKVAPPNIDEINMMPGKQVIFSSFQMSTQSREYIQLLLNKRITALGYEFYKDAREQILPIVQSMSEISGTTSVLIAAEYLSNANNGKGEMLGGISGISPTDVVILGAGTAGEYAARTALGLGAVVKVFDLSINKLRNLQDKLGTRIFTSVLQPRVLAKALRSADVVIGAIPLENEKRTFLVSEDAIQQMKPFSVIIDLMIDYGGCFETSQITSFNEPVFHKHGVIHYCVPNIPSRVARTASYALSNILGQIIIELAETGGINQMVRQHPGVRSGIYIYNGILTKQSIANKFKMPFQDINLIMAAF